MSRLVVFLTVLTAIYSLSTFSGWAGMGPCPNGCFRDFWAGTYTLM